MSGGKAAVCGHSDKGASWMGRILDARPDRMTGAYTSRNTGIGRRACLEAPGAVAAADAALDEEFGPHLARSRKRKAADRLLKYVATRQEMIRYPAFRAKGWQIGSGPTESQCKLCTKRLKGHGRRWDRPNTTAVAALDILDRSGQWQSFWPNASPAAV
jgi:hypothetical protein